jgi:hypothetical protein
MKQRPAALMATSSHECEVHSEQLSGDADGCPVGDEDNVRAAACNITSVMSEARIGFNIDYLLL